MQAKIICITETHLSAENVKELEIEIPKFKLIWEDMKNKTNFGETLYNTLKHIKWIGLKKLILRIQKTVLRIIMKFLI